MCFTVTDRLKEYVLYFKQLTIDAIVVKVNFNNNFRSSSHNTTLTVLLVSPVHQNC